MDWRTKMNEKTKSIIEYRITNLKDSIEMYSKLIEEGIERMDDYKTKINEFENEIKQLEDDLNK